MANTLKEQINSLIPQQKGKGRLGPAASRGKIESKRGVGKKVGTGSSSPSSSDGVASPLTEIVSKRTYYSERQIKSSDGLFVIAYKNVMSRTFIDANKAEVTLNYADDPVEEA